MKARILFVLVLSATVANLLVGCGSKEETIAPPSATGNKSAALGSKQASEHFTITLSTEPQEPKVGKAKFVAAVTHHGQPTEKAAIKLSLSMPSMNMGGMEVVLKHVDGGKYEGEADLSMGGDWQAKIIAEQEGHTGEGAYSFVVNQ